MVLGAAFLILASMAWADDKDSDADKRIDNSAKVLNEIMGVPDKAIPSVNVKENVPWTAQ